MFFFSKIIRITDKELELICKYSTKLEQLDILGSHGVSKEYAEMYLLFFF